jgi:serine/threonine-protein kinase
LPAVAEALAPKMIGSAQSLAPAAGESTKSARLESEAPRISAVPETAGERVASIATGGEHERPGLAVGGGQTLKAAEAEDRPIAPTEAISPIHVPVEPTATQSPFSLPDSVEPQPQAASTIVAQAIPHPAIELPPTHVLPDDPTLRMANFIRDYDGGSCFIAAPDMLGGKPQIEAYSSSIDLFRSFNEVFRGAFGVDPVLGMRQIRDLQCPAIGFIGKILKTRSPEIAVRLESDSIPSGSEIKGVLEGIRLSYVTLLFVDDDGMVHDVSRFLRRTVDGFEFSAPVYPTRKGKLRNQLVVAFAADRKLGLEKTDFAMSGSAYFSSMVRQADTSGAEISIGVGAFRIE